MDYAFTHRVWYLAADLDELEAIGKASRLLAYEGRALLRLMDGDHFSREMGVPLREAVHEHLRTASTHADGWRTTLIAYPRVAGFVFNPVSFYLSHDALGTLQHVVAEVHNTHGEREVYDFAPEGPGEHAFRSTTAKRLYVSPFIGPAAEYELRVVESRDQLAITIRETEPEGRALDAVLRLRRVPLTDARLARLVLGDPFVPVKTILLIGWHALRLWLRGQHWDRFQPRGTYGRN